MIAADILEVPRSYSNNRYLLVEQDYFTKWPEAIPLPDQTAARISEELVKIFSNWKFQTHYTQIKDGILKARCSDRPWRLSVLTKLVLQLTIIKGTAWWSASTDLCVNCYSHTLPRKRTGNATSPWCSTLIVRQFTRLQVSHHSSSCLEETQPLALGYFPTLRPLTLLLIRHSCEPN